MSISARVDRLAIAAVVFAAVAAITGGCTEGTPEPGAVVVRSTDCTYATIDLDGYLWHSADPFRTADGDVPATMVFSLRERYSSTTGEVGALRSGARERLRRRVPDRHDSCRLIHEWGTSARARQQNDGV